ncbi:ATP-grasp domain-containing protein [Mesorhizobium sp. M7A.F.Ca.CA.001.09.2.1]|uniref:Acetyl-CoA carboxylase biotin carboxylase subunit family protein n=1 Tax=Mesorhizobium ciceri TaxID=39645 RepID=A0AB38TF83_9HYPH|nr:MULTISPECIES: acetyl-CoA carboxylase biotin carboxylase subunit family protein [Mesorhizobium]RUY52736.1 ATP-grasp domain-containing protein [Mesorhizobium sp. M7A.F.Ca.CA.001.13.2.1]MDF3218618.1 acetyl-CoA carboxylase biotin carboxylase subunit family protein [Mesorhizobium ciceri]RUY61849.1 ATP-grasp domain-containing protein [Mesorhizobium sp. M7A.F.Ca.CA.001.13.1.1]RUY65066.1 ATP-grasp domain-containing protein [Mesorhizobium sp. M7A.F.Ca.CA.001.05.1.1]RUY73321.1 ATP-grasp domain-contai
MSKRALVLIEGDSTGNGLLFVQAAQPLGLHPITLSADPTQYEYLATEATEAIRVDTDNLDALIRECSRLRATYDIAGITSPWEPFYAIAGKLCRHFELPGPNPASIERCCDKSTQREVLAGAGIPIPAYRVAANAAEVEGFAAEIGLPVILKPTIGRGSSGVRLCRNVDELAEHTAHLLSGKHIGQSLPRMLVEEFAQGPQYTAHTMGKEVIGIALADFDPLPHFVYRGFTFPAVLTDDEHKRIADVSLSCLQALGLGWGPTNVELRWTKRGPVVIEVNPRLAGTPDPQLVQLAYGVDLVTEHIKLVIGSEWNLRRKHSHTAAARSLIPDRDGTLEWIDGGSQAAAVLGVAEVKLYVEPKTPIVRKGDDRDWIGHVIAASPSVSQTEAILQRAVDLIDWSITPFPPHDE